MAIVTLKTVLEEAKNHQAAVPMFNVLDLNMLKGILRAAEAERSPVIIAVAEVHLPYGSLELLGPILIREAERSTVPVCVHLDHGMDFDVIEKALELGFTSVMYDGSVLSYEENLYNTRQIVKLAKDYGASVEAELGHVGGGEGGDYDEHEAIYTEPTQAVHFVDNTGIGALAVAIGTAHGVYQSVPKLDLPRLAEINSLVGVPLVLHGGSGLSDDDFLQCIDRGIAKINICTELFIAANQAMSEGLSHEKNYPDINKLVEKAVFDAATKKLKLFNHYRNSSV